MQEFRISDTLWEWLSPHLPVHTPKAHPLGCHRRRVPDWQVLDGIFFVLRTGCQWNALSATRICSGSTAHARFQEGGGRPASLPASGTWRCKTTRT